MKKPYRLVTGQFLWDRRILIILMLIGAALVVRVWLAENPQHNPWAPLDLRDPAGWATSAKLADLRTNVSACRAVLERSEVAFTALPALGDANCARPDRTVLGDAPFSPARPSMTCPVAAGMHLWFEQTVQPVAENTLGSRVARLEHYGTYSCRRMYGSDSGPWSEHATGNAIDIAGFVLEDGRRITVLGGWPAEGAESTFLKQARDGACDIFGTVLSPDYNAAHADHFHFDQASRSFGGVCR